MTWEEVEETKLKPSSETAVQKPKRNIKISIPEWCGKWVVSMDEYAPGIVGAKSKNLAGNPSGPSLRVPRGPVPFAVIPWSPDDGFSSDTPC